MNDERKSIRSERKAQVPWPSALGSITNDASDVPAPAPASVFKNVLLLAVKWNKCDIASKFSKAEIIIEGV